MDKFKEQDSFLYYKNELVATFIPVISFVEVLHNRVTDSYTYKYHVSIKTVDCEMGYLILCKTFLFTSIGRNVQEAIIYLNVRKSY